MGYVVAKDKIIACSIIHMYMYNYTHNEPDLADLFSFIFSLYLR